MQKRYHQNRENKGYRDEKQDGCEDEDTAKDLNQCIILIHKTPMQKKKY